MSQFLNVHASLGRFSTGRRARILPALFGTVLLAAAFALQLGAGGSHAAVSSQRAVSATMHAFVHEDETIGLTFDDGSNVGSQASGAGIPTIPPGTYTVRVVDDADTHNFHLTGPGVDQVTVVEGKASPTWTVVLQPGSTYRYQCDPHLDYMWGTFQTSGASSGGGGSSSGGGGGSTSGGGGSSTTSSSGGNGSTSNTNSGSTKTVLRGTLSGSLTSAGKLTLAFQGRAVSKLKAGKYKVTVVDKTKSKGFVVQKSANAAIAVGGVSFVGTHTVTVNFTAGKWSFYTSPGTKPKTSFTVT